MRHSEDYRVAGVPMLPAVATEQHVAKQILVYTWLTAFVTLLLALSSGWLYDAVALLAAAWLVVRAHQLCARMPRGGPVEPLRLFKRSRPPGLRVLRAGYRFGAGAAEPGGALNA